MAAPQGGGGHRSPRRPREKLLRVQRLIGRRAIESLGSAKCNPPVHALGLDASYSRKYGAVAAAVLVDSSGRLLASALALGEPPLEYIPGLLAFREAPVFYTAYLGLEAELPSEGCTVLFVDGHGISHPRHAGIASHIGLALQTPSIGVAKRRLYGVERLARQPGQLDENVKVKGYIEDPRTGMKLAAVVAAGRGRLYVSPGAYLDLPAALHIFSMFYRPSVSRRLPLPTYHADSISRRAARCLDRGACTPEQLRGVRPGPRSLF